MATTCIPQISFGFEPKGKPVVAAFDVPHASVDGGAVLLKSLDTQLQLTKRLAGCLVDQRQPGKVQHQTLELVRKRVFGLACGYADCNDAARLADDAIHKLLLDRDPISGPALASQPTLSRFENAAAWQQLRDMAHVLADTVIETHRRRLRGRATRITIDLGPTVGASHCLALARVVSLAVHLAASRTRRRRHYLIRPRSGEQRAAGGVCRATASGALGAASDARGSEIRSHCPSTFLSAVHKRVLRPVFSRPANGVCVFMNEA